MGTNKTSEYKFNWLKKCFNNAKEQGVSLNIKKLEAQFCISHNSTPRKFKELMELFKNAEIIMIYDGEIGNCELIKENKDKVFK